VDVHFCGLTGSDVLLWCGKHRSTPKSTMVLGFEVSGTILEMGRLAHEQTGYQMGEEVVVHNYPVCGGLAESCLAHYRVGHSILKRRDVLICMLQICSRIRCEIVICKYNTNAVGLRTPTFFMRAAFRRGSGPLRK